MNTPGLCGRVSLRTELQAAYGIPGFRPLAWSDSADHGYVANHLLERGLALLADSLEGDLLDVGCGAQPYKGRFTRVARYMGCDIDSARGPVDVVCPADALPFEPGRFGAVLCTEVLEHVPDPAAVLGECARVVRPGGRLLVSVPLFWPPHELPHDYWRFTGEGLVRLVLGAGLDPLRLVPRGGVWAFLGQAAVHAARQYFAAPGLRRLWNRAALGLDRARANPDLTLGWTLLAGKPVAELPRSSGERPDPAQHS